MSSNYQKQLHADRDELIAAEIKGEARGKVEGIREGETKEKILIANKLLAQGVDLTIISAVTGLSLQDIEKLKS